MDKALFTAMSGAKQTMQAQTVHANNLANISTTGFQRDFVTAQSRYVHADYAQPSRAMALTATPATDFSLGALQETGRDLDVALEGEGFIAVIAKDGTEAYTRAGNLRVDSLGQLTTGNGLPVLGNGAPIAIPPAEKVEIGVDGTISIRALGQGPDALATVDRIKLVRANANELQKRTDGLLQAKDGNPLDPNANARVVAGYLETSNVNAVEAMTEVLALSRQFELQVKFLHKVDQNTEAATRLLSVS